MATISKELEKELGILQKVHEIERFTSDLPPYKLAYIIYTSPYSNTTSKSLIFYPACYNIRDYLKNFKNYHLYKDDVTFYDIFDEHRYFHKPMNLIKYLRCIDPQFMFNQLCYDIITCDYNVEEREKELFTLYDDLIEKEIPFIAKYHPFIIPVLTSSAIGTLGLPFVFSNIFLFSIPLTLFTLLFYSFFKLCQHEKS